MSGSLVSWLCKRLRSSINEGSSLLACRCSQVIRSSMIFCVFSSVFPSTRRAISGRVTLFTACGDILDDGGRHDQPTRPNISAKYIQVQTHTLGIILRTLEISPFFLDACQAFNYCPMSIIYSSIRAYSPFDSATYSTLIRSRYR